MPETTNGHVTIGSSYQRQAAISLLVAPTDSSMTDLSISYIRYFV